jgi:hypothetical protein
MKNKLGLGILIFLFFIIGVRGSGAQGETRTRNFVLFFETLDYTREIGDALSFFFYKVMAPGDQLIIYTPARVYGFSKMTLAKPKSELVATMQDRLRADTAACSSSYKIIMNDMTTQVRDIENSETSTADGLASLKESLTMYGQNLNNLKALRKVNDTLLRQMVNMFKTQQGQNHIIMIYQTEFRPIPDRETLNRLRAIPVISFEVTELFASENQNVPLDADEFIDLFKETPISLHLFYIKTKDISPGQNFKEQSADMYDVFSRMAKGSGGIVETTANPEASFKALLRAIEPAK